MENSSVNSPTLVVKEVESPQAATESISPDIPFPKSSIVGIGKEFVDLYGPNLESPPEFLYAAWHTCFGLCISPHIRLNLSIYSRPRLYTVLLGESGWSRKSTAINTATRFWSDLAPGVEGLFDSPRPKFRTEYGLGSVEGFARVFSGWNKKETDEGGGAPDTRPTLVTYDELNSFVVKANQKGSLLSPFMNSLFETEEYDGTTSKRIVSLRDCKVALLAASTLDTYARMWTADFTAIGFPNRLFILKGSRTKSVPFPEEPSATALSALRARVRKLVTKVEQWSAANQGILTLAPDALEVWREYYPEIERGGVHAKRLDSYAFKWMTLLALSQEEFQVGRIHVEQAIELIEYELAVRREHDPIDADNEMAKMEEKIRRVLKRRDETKRRLQQLTNANRTGSWIFETAFQNLLKSGEVQMKAGVCSYAW
jgi:hypothetical protein